MTDVCVCVCVCWCVRGGLGKGGETNRVRKQGLARFEHPVRPVP